MINISLLIQYSEETDCVNESGFENVNYSYFQMSREENFNQVIWATYSKVGT